MVAAELVDDGNVIGHIPIATNVVVDDKIAATGLAVVWYVVAQRGRPEALRIFSSSSKIVSWASFVLPVM